MADTRRMTDAQIIQQARRKVLLTTSGYYLLLAAVLIGGSYLLSLPLLAHAALLDHCWIISSMTEWILLLGLLALFLSEKPWTRTVYWIFFGLDCFTLLLPVWVFFKNPGSLLACLFWMILIGIKLFALYGLGRWLNTSKEAKIYFDRVLQQVVTPEELAAKKAAQQEAALRARRQAALQSQQAQSHASPSARQTSSAGTAAANRSVGSRHNTAQVRASTMRQPDFSGGDARRPVVPDVGAMLYPKLAVRLGAVVYASLILFPIVVQIFQNAFVSTDNQQVFATRLIFTACIITAVLWTIPVVFLYLKEPFSKTCVLFCLLLESVAALWFGFQLYGYAHSTTVQYGWHVYLYLIVLDVARLALLWWGLAPVFSTPKPRADVDEQEMLQEQQLPDDLIIADDDDFFEEVPEDTEEKNPDFLTKTGSNLRTRLSDLSTRILLDDPGSPKTEAEDNPPKEKAGSNPDPNQNPHQ